MKQAANIMIVADESSITGAMEMILREQGYQIKTATTSDEAIEIFQGNKSEAR